jgi:hypothetical protein
MFWPANCQLEKKALRRAECSIMKAVELPNSPATAKPCSRRAANTAIGAINPTEA